MSQFKGRMLKGKVGCGDEVRTQETHARQRQYLCHRGMGAGDGSVSRWYKIGTLGFITTRVQPRVQSIMKGLDKNPSLTYNRMNKKEQEQQSWSTPSLPPLFEFRQAVHSHVKWISLNGLLWFPVLLFESGSRWN